MASNPSPAKRARTDASHPSSSSRSAQNNGGARFVTSTLQPLDAPVQDVEAQAPAPTQPSPAIRRASSSTTSQPRPSAGADPLASVPPGWGPMAIPENMTMSLHEALEILDPAEKMPHDLYSILVYAAAAHPDVGRMLDKFARAENDARRQRQEQERREPEPIAAVRFMPIDPTRRTSTTERDAAAAGAGGGGDSLWELVEHEKRDRAEARAARKVAREAKEAKARERRQRKTASSVVEPGMDKDFDYMVRKAEEQLGWTGRWDPDRDSQYSRMALRKESYWYNRAADVRDNLRWMQRELTKEMGVVGATFGTKRNALLAIIQILRAVVVDDRSGVGRNLRDHWFVSLQEIFREAMATLGYGVLARLRKEGRGRWTKDLKALIRLARDKELPDAILQEILLLVDPTSGDHIESDDEASEDTDEASGSETGNGDEDAEGETSAEASSESETDSEREEDGD